MQPRKTIFGGIPQVRAGVNAGGSSMSMTVRMHTRRTAKFVLIWVNLAVNITVSYEVFPSGQTLKTIQTFWTLGANNVWSNLMNDLKGTVM